MNKNMCNHNWICDKIRNHTDGSNKVSTTSGNKSKTGMKKGMVENEQKELLGNAKYKYIYINTNNDLDYIVTLGDVELSRYEKLFLNNSPDHTYT